jgi:hypothetical protein
MVRVGVASNAANPGWHGLQNTRSRHAEQTVEVVRNHEGGPSGSCGSELPRVVFTRETGCFGITNPEGSLEWTRDDEVGGGARANESHERRTNEGWFSGPEAL